MKVSAVSRSPSLKPRVNAVTSVILLISNVLSLNFSKISFCASVSVSVSFFFVSGDELQDMCVFSGFAEAAL